MSPDNGMRLRSSSQTGRALKHVLKTIIESDDNRQQFPDLVMIVTDGRSTDYPDDINTAKIIRDGVQLIPLLINTNII
jgi:hypothetical protein